MSGTLTYSYNQPQPGDENQPQPGYENQPQPGYGNQPQPGYGNQPQPGYGNQPQPGYGAPPYVQQPGYSHGGGTTVIVNQPRPVVMGPRMWTTSLCALCDDIPICCCGLCCGLACGVSTDMGESCCVPCCVPGAEIILRTKWRTQENIPGSILDDCMTVYCCGPCAMCQLARDIKNKKRGIFVPFA